MRRLVPWRLVEEGRLLVDEPMSHPVDPADDLLAGADPRLVRSFVEQGARVERHYVAEVTGGVLIEPARGWAVRPPNRLVAASLPYARAETHDTPAFGRYWAKRVLGTSRRFEEVLSLRDRSDWNYWHVIGDVLPRIFDFEDAGAPVDTPLVVAAHTYRSPAFRALVRRAGLEGRDWIVQGPREHVRADRAWFSAPARYRRQTYDRLLAALGVTPQQGGERRIFVTRRGGWRGVSNLEALEQVAGGLGFEIVDPGELTLDEQIAAFADARVVVAVHGAALANVIFRAGAPLDVLELFSPAWLEHVYFQVCRAFGYSWSGLVGDAVGGFDFSVDPARLEAELGRLLDRAR